MFKEVLSALKNHANAEEIEQIHTFSCYRGNIEYMVELHDKGSGAGNHRYFARAYRAGIDLETAEINGETLSQGNPAKSIDEAINDVHWYALKP